MNLWALVLRAWRLRRGACPHCGYLMVRGFGDSTEEIACPQGHYIFGVFMGRRAVWRDRAEPLLPGEPYSR